MDLEFISFIGGLGGILGLIIIHSLYEIKAKKEILANLK